MQTVLALPLLLAGSADVLIPIDAATVRAVWFADQAQQPTTRSAAERSRIRTLAADVPALWHATTTRGADRRTIVRLLIARVELTRRGETELIDATVHWRSGAEGRYPVRQALRGSQHLGRYAELKQRVME